MPRHSRSRYLLVAISLAFAGQLPGAILLCAALAPRIGPWASGLVLAICCGLTLPLVLRLLRGASEWSEQGLFGIALVLFFAWWGTSVVAGLVAPLALSLAALARAPRQEAYGIALLTGAVVGVAGATVRRTVPHLNRVDVPIANLPPSLHGYRIAQLSDLHMGNFTSPARVRVWVERVNVLGADLVTVTGDLIATGNRFLEAVAIELGRLRARDGVALCLGNHDYFGDHERLVRNLEKQGIEVLRNRGRWVHREDSGYWLAGVDDTWQRRDDVASALAGKPDGQVAIVLAHDPVLFDECAEHGATLVLSGHTHGGQLAVPLLSRTLNLARLAHRYTTGLYRRGAAHLYVNRGAGTTGPPLRIGSTSEIALLTLRPAPV